MIKVLVLFRRREGMTFEEFRTHALDVHVPLLKQLPGIRKLSVNFALPDPTGAEPAFDGAGEDWFDSPEAMGAAFASPAGQAVTADGATFIDMASLRMVVVEEIEVDLGVQVASRSS